MQGTIITKTITYYDYPESECIEKGKLDTFDPITADSVNFKHWVTHESINTCRACILQNGKIYRISETPLISPPLHPNCRCEIARMEAITAGGATKDGENGADFWLKYFGCLPNYYVTEQEAKNNGWRYGKSPLRYVPGKMITRGEYKNDDGHLPSAPGKTWQEADINYYEGKRNRHRILWSNDGLIFVTYDHYRTFYEIT